MTQNGPTVPNLHHPIPVNRHPARRLLGGLSCCVLALALRASAAWAVAPQIDHHDLDVRLTPSAHRLEATDHLRVVWDPAGGRPLTFTLADTLTVDELRLEQGGAVDWTTEPGVQGHQQVTVVLPPSLPPQVGLVVRYHGTLADAVSESEALTFVAGDRTRGIVSDAGVYLAGETGWTPAAPDDLATYRVTVTVPDGWEVCTQGRLVEQHGGPDGWRARWESTVPSDGLALVAGRWIVERRRVGDLVIATYLFPDHADASREITDWCAEYIAQLSDLLGPYPFPEFAVVENFFSSGYAFPGFTLLGRGVLAAPERLREPGYLDHEICHNWWGNGVMPDPRQGNWSEAITTYCANYRAAERQGPEAAEAYRRGAQLRFSLYAPAGTDYPLNLFQEKSSKLDDAVGYIKGAMVFHLMRQAVGDDVFWATLRDIAQLNMGTRIGWSTFVSALSQRSGKSLDRWVGDWLYRAGVPELRLADMRTVPTAVGYRLEGVLAQAGEPYALTLPMVVQTSAGEVRTQFATKGANTAFALAVDGLPLHVAVDPEAQVLRRLPPREQTPCLNRTLYGGSPVCVYPEDPRDRRTVHYRALAERAAKERGGVAVPISEVTSRLVEGKSVLLFGDHHGHPVLAALAAEAADVLDVVNVGPQGFSLRGERHDAPGDSVLATVPRPDDPAHTFTIYAGNSEEALARSAMMFFYGWDSVVRFEAGRPVERFDLPPAASALEWDGLAAVSDPANTGEIASLVRRLADPWMAGRMTGDAEIGKARDLLLEYVRRLGLEPVALPDGTAGYRQDFTLPDPRLATRDPFVHFVARSGDETARVWPVWWSAPAAAQGDVTFVGYGWGDSEWDDYGRGFRAGDVAVAFGGGPPGRAPDDPVAALVQQAQFAQARGAAGLLVVVPQDDLATYLPAIAMPHPDLPWPAPQSPRGNGAEAQPQPALRAARIRSAADRPDTDIRIPVWVMPWDRDAQARIARGLTLARWYDRLQSRPRPTAERARGVELRAPDLWTRGSRKGVNIVGRLPGRDPFLKDRVIVIGAHYDHLGIAESGEVFRGADDNASGVAALLQAAEMLANRHALLQRTVVFVLFDGEEWGLAGSRAFLAARVVPPERIEAMLNVDSVGRNVEDRVYLVGASHYPELGAVAARWAQAIGLTLGPDIDRYAYERGSDHWPFARRGIPALDLFASDYRAIDSLGDVPDKVDAAHVGRVARLLASVAYELATRPAPESEPRPSLATVVPAVPPQPTGELQAQP